VVPLPPFDWCRQGHGDPAVDWSSAGSSKSSNGRHWATEAGTPRVRPWLGLGAGYSTYGKWEPAHCAARDTE